MLPQFECRFLPASLTDSCTGWAWVLSHFPSLSSARDCSSEGDVVATNLANILLRKLDRENYMSRPI